MTAEHPDRGSSRRRREPQRAVHWRRHRKGRQRPTHPLVDLLRAEPGGDQCGRDRSRRRADDRFEPAPLVNHPLESPRVEHPLCSTTLEHATHATLDQLSAPPFAGAGVGHRVRDWFDHLVRPSRLERLVALHGPAIGAITYPRPAHVVAFCIALAIAASVAVSRSVGLNWMNSVPASAAGRVSGRHVERIAGFEHFFVVGVPDRHPSLGHHAPVRALTHAAGQAGEHRGEIVILTDRDEVDGEVVELARAILGNLEVHRDRCGRLRRFAMIVLLVHSSTAAMRRARCQGTNRVPRFP